MMNSEKKSDSSISHVKSKIKVVFLGDQSTGKTSILLRFMHDKFQQSQGATVGIDFMAKNITVKQTSIRLQLWDTAGQERFRSLIPSYLKDATVIFIIFDLTNRKSFQNVKEWIQLCAVNRKDKSIMVLIGNKVDLDSQRVIKKNEAEELAKNQNMPYFEVSAKKNIQVKEVFMYAAEQYVRDMFGNQMTIGNIQNIHNNLMHQLGDPVIKNITINLSDQPIKKQNNKKKSGCC